MHWFRAWERRAPATSCFALRARSGSVLDQNLPYKLNSIKTRPGLCGRLALKHRMWLCSSYHQLANDFLNTSWCTGISIP